MIFKEQPDFSPGPLPGVITSGKRYLSLGFDDYLQSLFPSGKGLIYLPVVPCPESDFSVIM
jgi:hypothetical protein